MLSYGCSQCSVARMAQKHNRRVRAGLMPDSKLAASEDPRLKFGR